MNNKHGSIIAADGMLYIYDESGEVALVEPTIAGFKKISAFKYRLAVRNTGHTL
ncbi:MAG: hypothetical protein U0Z17_11860 [Bacteroidales bacterium]